MFTAVKQSIKYLHQRFIFRGMPVYWVKKEERSRLTEILAQDYIKPKITHYSQKIERLASKTNSLGAQPLWEGYKGDNLGGSTRMPDRVRTATVMGNFYSYLVQKQKPRIIVEFGTAFGVSGMYFLAGINANNGGKLLTFEPNVVWANIAKSNLSQISDKFVLTVGTFEENIDNVLKKDQRIDMAFIDAIHTKEFVISQLDIVVARCNKNAIIILDDINFSDSMMDCWKSVSTDSRFSVSVSLDNRVGLLELK